MRSHLMIGERGDWWEDWKKCIQRKAPSEWTKSACATCWSLQHKLNATSAMQLVSRVLSVTGENFNIVT